MSQCLVIRLLEARTISHHLLIGSPYSHLEFLIYTCQEEGSKGLRKPSGSIRSCSYCISSTVISHPVSLNASMTCIVELSERNQTVQKSRYLETCAWICVYLNICVTENSGLAARFAGNLLPFVLRYAANQPMHRTFIVYTRRWATQCSINAFQRKNNN